MADFNLVDLYQRAFGHVRPPYPLLVNGLPGVNPAGTLIGLREQFDIDRDEEPVAIVPVEAKSQWGTVELKFPVKLRMEEFDGDVPIGIREFLIPLEPVISIEGSKNLIETRLNRGARVENVLEEINLNNYRVLMRGIILSELSDTYPDAAIRELRKFCEAPGGIEIECALLQYFGITRVAVQNFRFPGVPGNIEAVGYELDCISDPEIDLEDVPESRTA